MGSVKPGMTEIIIGVALILVGIFLFGGLVEIAFAVVGVIVLGRGIQKQRTPQ